MAVKVGLGEVCTLLIWLYCPLAIIPVEIPYMVDIRGLGEMKMTSNRLNEWPKFKSPILSKMLFQSPKEHNYALQPLGVWSEYWFYCVAKIVYLLY